ncbi:MAG: winged helix-turn-helix domain-containing protein [Candidatus Obscuribacterales bacterium]|nr:winged helix-turn-helix domain-containing protein [Candidatus Obscuribacterales bacterium]
MRRPNQVVSLEVLLRSAWDSTSEAAPDVVRTTVKRLRDKIDIEGSPSLIATKYGIGYAFEVAAANSI